MVLGQRGKKWQETGGDSTVKSCMFMLSTKYYNNHIKDDEI
jgi:hypothetical protein